MRALLVVVMLGGCFGSSTGGGGGSRPGVMPMLSELPSDPAKRDAILDSSNVAAGPEQRKGMTRKERKVETAAATAAVVLGSMFSSTQTVTLGSASTFDETQLVAPPAPRPHGPAAGDPAPPAEDAGPSNADLIPWIKLK